jgi:hypothetical protein
MLFNDVSHYADQPHRPEKHLSRWWDGGNPPEMETDLTELGLDRKDIDHGISRES